jgi:septal ring factor EnvC (AmiA/AmiB activator)
MEETLKQYSLLEWIIGGGLFMFLLEKVFWRKFQKNADAIEASIIDSVKESKSKLIEHDKKFQSVDFRIKNMEGELEFLKDAWSENNKALTILNDTIRKFDDNMKIFHNDIRTQNAEIKMSLDRSNNLVEQANKTYQEFIGVIKELKKS